MDVFGQGGCIREIKVFIRAKLLYSGKSGCIRARWLYSGNKWFYIGLKWLYSGRSGCTKAKVVLFGQKWLYSEKQVVFGQKRL